MIHLGVNPFKSYRLLLPFARTRQVRGFLRLAFWVAFREEVCHTRATSQLLHREHFRQQLSTELKSTLWIQMYTWDASYAMTNQAGDSHQRMWFASKAFRQIWWARGKNLLQFLRRTWCVSFTVMRLVVPGPELLQISTHAINAWSHWEPDRLNLMCPFRELTTLPCSRDGEHRNGFAGVYEAWARSPNRQLKNIHLQIGTATPSYTQTAVCITFLS